MFQTQLPWVSRDPCQLRFCPEMFSCQDLPASCQHMLRSDTLLSSELHTAGWLFLPGSATWRAGSPLSPPGIWTQRCCTGYANSCAGPRFQGSGCNSFASYVRSQCHFLAPLILSPAHPNTGAEAAAPVLKESVSVSPGTHLLWAAWWCLFQLKKATKTFCPHRSEDFSVF